MISCSGCKHNCISGSNASQGNVPHESNFLPDLKYMSTAAWADLDLDKLGQMQHLVREQVAAGILPDTSQPFDLATMQRPPLLSEQPTAGLSDEAQAAFAAANEPFKGEHSMHALYMMPCCTTRRSMHCCCKLHNMVPVKKIVSSVGSYAMSCKVAHLLKPLCLRCCS